MQRSKYLNSDYENDRFCVSDPHTVYMDVNVLPALTTMLGTTSDLVIAFMTINRFHLIKSKTNLI
jgi:hypothetical protein